MMEYNSEKNILTDIFFLNKDIYATYKALLNHDKKVIIKIFTEYSDDNNEIEVMEYLQSNSLYPNLFPKPYFKIQDHAKIIDFLNCYNIDLYEDVYKVLVYEYMEGQDIRDISININKLYTDVYSQLVEMHRLYLVHGDIRRPNIIFTGERYLLIDYGRTFSSMDKNYPPMNFMTDDVIPTKETDLQSLLRLQRLLRSI